jgi:hypothetical protein
MAKYHVNSNAQANGDHEVHVSTCDHKPEPKNQVDLGEFSSCHAAVTAAKKYYSDVDGCYYCCNPCHKS